MIALITEIIGYILRWLKKPLVDLWHFVRTNDINYIKIGKCKTDDSYILYLKKLSLLEELAIMVKNNSNDECCFKKLNIHDIKFDNFVELSVPSGWIDYSLIIKYTLKYNIPKIYNRRKNCNPKERIITQVYGAKGIRTLHFRILES